MTSIHKYVQQHAELTHQIDDTGTSEAVLSADGRYRYYLSRRWQPRFTGQEDSILTFVMLNPSTADALQDDPTIRRCVGFAKSFGANVLQVINLYGFRATKPAGLLTVDDPVGRYNTAVWAQALKGYNRIVLAWGNSPTVRKLSKHTDAVELLKAALYNADALSLTYCLEQCKDGTPKHPLYLKADTPLKRLEV